MTDTARTHVTLEKSYMELVEELIDVFGATKAQVISNIVQLFFNESKNDALLEKLRARKRKIKPPDSSEINEKITEYLKRADNIPFDVFVNHLKLDPNFVVEHLNEWGEKHDFMFIDNKIVKEK
ncbi:MAG: hypothetical protein ACFE8A_10050 [Candidatus Hodarchaeota archaeon]